MARNEWWIASLRLREVPFGRPRSLARRPSMRSKTPVAALALLLSLAGLAAAQEITATITGTLTDETGGVLPGVTVTVKNTGTGLTKDVVTNAEGAYTASCLPVGRYEVAFALGGFQNST